jgi:hypothetical protein
MKNYLKTTHLIDELPARTEKWETKTDLFRIFIRKNKERQE